jgi:hypothetical protein
MLAWTAETSATSRRMLSVAASSTDRRLVDRIVLGNGEAIVVRAQTIQNISHLFFLITY